MEALCGQEARRATSSENRLLWRAVPITATRIDEELLGHDERCECGVDVEVPDELGAEPKARREERGGEGTTTPVDGEEQSE